MQQTHEQRKRFKALTLTSALLLSSGAFAQTVGPSTIPDEQIEASVLKALAGAPQLASEYIVTTTVSGTVTLSGSVKDEPTRKMAERLAAGTFGVKKVVDELTLGDQAAVASSKEQGTNPTLQSDGTMAPAPGQAHAPDPDTYAAQHGISAPTDDGGPNTAQQAPNSGMQPPPPGYRQPYGGNPQQPSGDRQPPYDNQQQARNQPSYPPQGGYRGQQPLPPPYGAQQAGLPITVPSGSLLRVRINEGLDSKHSQPGTPFDAVVLNDVVADGAVAIPRGASVQGKVTEAKSGGVLAGHGELALQLTQVILGGKTFPITSDVWSRQSDGKGGQTVGNAIGLGAAGAIIGAIAGGGAGAAIGAGVGGAAGVGASAASGNRQVLIPSEAILTFHLAQPAPMTTISQAEMDRLSYGVPVGAQQQAPRMVRRYPAPYYGPVYYPRPYYPYPY